MIAITVTAGSKDGPYVDDWSDAEGIVFRSAEHGNWSFECFIVMGQYPALEFYELGYDLCITISYGGFDVWCGRVEDVAVQADGLQIVAMGLWSTFNDFLYSALWSDSGYGNWDQLTNDHNAVYDADRWEADNNNRLRIVPRKGEDFETGKKGGWAYEIPHKSDRDIVRVVFDYEFKASSDWIAKCRTANGAWASESGGEWTLTGNGTIQSGSASLDWTSYATDRLLFMMYYDDGTPTEYTGETGDYYLKITGITLRTLDSVDHICGKEVAKGLLDYVVARNSDVAADYTLIECPNVDLDTFIVEDVRPARILDDLVAMGDDSTPPRYFEAGMWGNRLHFRKTQISSTDDGHHKVWYASISEFETERSLSLLVNQAYATYGDQRTDRATKADSVAVHGITREETVSVSTESATRAELARDALLQDQCNIEPRASFLIDQIKDGAGADTDFWEIRSGDFMHLVNLPPDMRELDKVRAFRIRTTEYDPIEDRLILTPLELPQLEIIAARG